VNLIASRTQLRLSLQEHNRSGRASSRERIRRILSDAQESVDVVESLAVYDVDGDLVAFAGEPPGSAALGGSASVFPVSDGVFYRGVSASGSGELRVGFLAELILEGERLGELQVGLNAEALLDVTENRAGLGETGRAVIITRDEEGTARILNRSEQGDSDVWDPVRLRGLTDPLAVALEEEGGVYWEGITDAQEDPVWAAVEYIPEADWGLVVTLDASEGREPVLAYRAELFRLILALAAFPVLLGVLLGLRFARPIHELAEAANRIREGSLSARAPVVHQDEVGVLARTFNHMADELEQQVSLLREFKRYFEVSQDMLCIAGTDGFFKRVNPAFERILGWSSEELLSRSFLDFTHPDDLASTQREIDHLAQGIPTISFENRYQCKNGSYRHLVWSSYPEPETGLLYAIARDITDLKEERERTVEEIRDLHQRLEAAEAKLRGIP
jgi:PAS domain S-box-containing protein